ncbi:hypothetical protein ACRC7T_00065 [Segnochrobactraceae bacterium EtOH-i3]
MRRSITGSVLVLAGLLAAGASAGAADLAGSAKKPATATAEPTGLDRVPACDAAAVLRAVTARTTFSLKFKNPEGPTLKELGTPQQLTFIELAEGEIGRRYCKVKVELSEGKSTEAFYLVEEKMNFASAPWPRGTGWAMRWGTDVCVVGTDKWHVYDGDCRTLRPPPVM